MKSFIDNQGKEEPIYLWIRIGEKVSFICVFSFAFMIGDSLSQDRMCGCYLAYANIPRLCCACNVTLEESENPNHDCNFLIWMTSIKSAKKL